MRMRPLDPAGDIQRIVDFASRVRAGAPVLDYPGLLDLPLFLMREPNRTTARVFFQGETLLAYAFVDAFLILRFDLDHARTTPALETAILEWYRQCVAHAAAPQPALVTTAHQADAQRIALLERIGFRRRVESIVHLQRALADPVAPAELPRGFTIRAVQGEQEAAAVAALHRAAFGTPHLTTERRLAVMRSRTYRPEIDLVAETAGGALAAYGMGTVDEAENRISHRNDAYADQFATHPEFRGAGLAQALLAEVLCRLQPGGYAFARMSTDSTNAAMLRVARAGGFDVLDHTFRFEQRC